MECKVKNVFLSYIYNVGGLSGPMILFRTIPMALQSVLNLLSLNCNKKLNRNSDHQVQCDKKKTVQENKT